MRDTVWKLSLANHEGHTVWKLSLANHEGHSMEAFISQS